jgi:hypothetical protein
MMERGESGASQTRMSGASFLVPFQRLEKGLARVGETKSISRTRQSAELKSSSTDSNASRRA